MTQTVRAASRADPGSAPAQDIGDVGSGLVNARSVVIARSAALDELLLMA
ncbi:MAG: hypothetical protein GX555_17335 [Actinomycetales bacterium]|nr:hypothetical protein [Actinomycetales bacterium]